MNEKILSAALKYAEYGWAVFPCNKKKEPLTENGFYAASKDPAVIKQFFTKHTHCTIGVATGKISGFWVLDIDVKNGGKGTESLEGLENQYGKLPHTVESITWSGGRHIFFKYPDTGLNCRTEIRTNIDVRGDGGYIIIPPSIVNEKEYVWELSSLPKETEIAEAPDWLYRIIKENRRSIELPEEGTRIPKNKRNDTLMRIGVKLRNSGLSYEFINEILQKTNISCCEPPLSESEVKKVAQSVARYKAEILPVDDNIITLTQRDSEVMIFSKNGYEFRFSNIAFYGAGKLKAILTLSKDRSYILKTDINLSSHSQREKFVKAADDKDLEQILVELENLIRRQLKIEEEEATLKAKQSYVMNDQEKTEAAKFLSEANDILYRVIDATNRMGVVGEEILRLIVYLCFTSRILKDPISVTVKGESSSGKSFSCQNVQKLIPEEGYHFITRATQNAFYHLPEDGMQHKIIYINELQGSETADYSIRSAQSEGDLILMMPIKDPATGNMETVTKRVKGPVGFLITTTKANMFDENETRNFSVFSDDTPGLTQRIGKISIRKAQGEVFELDHKEVNLWRNMQRLLKPDLKVIIPYAEEVLGSFPDYPVRVRRDRERFRILINVITILHQTHRKIENGLIYSTIADYQIAKILGEEILIKTIFESSPAADTLMETISQMEDEHRPFGLPGSHSTDPYIEEGYTFTYQDIADKLGWDKQKVRKWSATLTKNGLFTYVGGGHGAGKPSIMRLNKQKLQVHNKFLPSIGGLLEKYPCDTSLFYDPLTGQRGIFDENNTGNDEKRPF